MLAEDLPPSEEEIGARYFHGTPREEKAEAIIRDGVLVGRDVQGRSFGAPRKDFVYLPRNIEDALPYVLGANYAGTSLPPEIVEREGQYGYLFVVEGKDLKDIEPDEDYVGNLIYDLSRKRPEELTTRERQFLSFANSELTPRQMHHIKYGEYLYWAAGGKRLLKRVRQDWMMRFILDNVPVVSNRGPVPPSEAWRMDKNRAPELESDGSNFFDVAEKVWER
jgi:hypothetical protein